MKEDSWTLALKINKDILQPTLIFGYSSILLNISHPKPLKEKSDPAGNMTPPESTGKSFPGTTIDSRPGLVFVTSGA